MDYCKDFIITLNGKDTLDYFDTYDQAVKFLKHEHYHGIIYDKCIKKTDDNYIYIMRDGSKQEFKIEFIG